MSPNDARIRVFRIALGDLTTRPCPMETLAAGDRIVGPDETTVFEVTEACASNDNSWLLVRDLTMTDRRAAAHKFAHPENGPDSDGREFFFAYRPNTPMHLVVPDTTKEQRR